MMKKNMIFTTILLFALCLFPTRISAEKLTTSNDEVITKGVYIDSIHIGGMTGAEANQAVQDYVDDLRSKKITLNIDNNLETITLSELDYNYISNNYIEEALNAGKAGNLIKRYKELKDIEEQKLVFTLEFAFDDNKIREFVESKCSIYNISAVNATITRQSGSFQYTDELVGRKVEVEETINTIQNSLLEGWNQQDVVLNAKVVNDEPLYTREMVEKCDTIIGTFATTYASSSQDRAGNLANGARLINNKVLYPDDVFSAYELLTPFTTANGYYEAGAYANGKVVDSIGGGACQVTTTLYNAVLLAELEIVERAAHSMTIGYVDLSRDAAIAGTWKDLKFKNNSEVPVVIEAYTVGRTITFTIWGDEVRDTNNRKLKFETVIVDETQPGKDVVTEDPKQPTTYEVTTQSAHVGYVTELYKIVYEDGVEVSRTRINKSIYNASPRYVTVGTKPVEEEPEEDLEVDPTIDTPIEEVPIEDIQNEGTSKNEKPKNEKPKNEKPKQEEPTTNTEDDNDETTDLEFIEDGLIQD